MAISKPSIPKGMRDFSPVEMARRNYIFDTIRSVFKLYGYQPIETPTMENLGTLMGKYGQEGDKLLFKVLDSGDFTRGVDMVKGVENPALLSSQICEKGLRYDLTVPFARYVVQHQNDITFPFKRFQIQPVWRADRPQRGRYREFYQCDVDVVGSDSLLWELELIQIVERVFAALLVNVTLKVNNRKILYGIAQSIGFSDKMMDITMAIDKLDKIGLEQVKVELQERGLTSEAIDSLTPILTLSGTNVEKLDKMATLISVSEVGMQGIEEMRTIFGLTKSLGLKLDVELDLSLARGLNYYTGAIFEVKARDFEIGSISGGGRYDDLTGIFGLKNVSGVGISFGADRIYDVLLGLNLFPEATEQGVRAMFVNFGGDCQMEALGLLAGLRESGVPSEIYSEPVKLKKQFDYAVSKGIPYMIFIGETELEEVTVTVKNIVTGEQQTIPQNQLISHLK